MSFPIYQVNTAEPMLFCVNIGAPHSCIGNKVLENIIRHSGRKSIPKIDSKRDFKFDDILVGSIGMVGLMLLTRGSTLDMPVILDVVDVEILPLLGVYVLGKKPLLVDNITNHL